MEIDKNLMYPVGEKNGDTANNVGEKMTVGAGCFCTGCCLEKDDMKLLPCLHVCCMGCLITTVDNRFHSSGKKTTMTLYSCPKCGHKGSVTGAENVMDVFKNVPSFIRVRHVDQHIISEMGDEHSDDSCTTGHQENGNRGNIVSVCQDCTVSVPQNKALHCNECIKIICEACCVDNHETHSTVAVWDFIQRKVDYIQCLVGDIAKKVLNHENGLFSLSGVMDYLLTVKEDIKCDITQRADYLINLVEQRKCSLLAEMDETFSAHMERYNKIEESFTEQLKQFKFVSDFSSNLANNGCYEDVLNFHNDVSSQCMHQLHQIPEAKVDIISMKIDIPGKGKEQSMLEKLFGTLKEGTVLSGHAELLASFNVDMKWPTSIAVSSSKEVVVTGKRGAFDCDGKAIFFDSRGRFHSKVNFDPQHVPIDIHPAGDGTVWLSNSAGEIQNLSVAGRVLRTVPNVFSGSGHIGTLSDASLVVASAASKEVKILNELGQFIKSIKIPYLNDITPEPERHNNIKLNCLTATSDNTIIIGNADIGRVIGLDLEGKVLFKYDHNNATGLTPALKCPSALCCDPFDNILVADFTNDNIHLLSKMGIFLGCLLSKANGLSCPNCLALDSEGRLYVGQYGGDILMFSYMSCSKKV